MLYASLLQDVIPDSFGHILIASIIHAPAALVLAAIMVPETEPQTVGREIFRSEATSAMDAVAKGTWDGLQLLFHIVAILIVFVALVKLVNIGLGAVPDVAGSPLSLERILGVIMASVVWLIGVPWEEARVAGSLMGTKVVLNELLAYIEMAKLPGPLPSFSYHPHLCHVQLCQSRQPGHIHRWVGRSLSGTEKRDYLPGTQVAAGRPACLVDDRSDCRHVVPCGIGGTSFLG
nr:nucleoside transporter C-terminal domain-containing protein [uncultured Desulfobulbus sp.]